MENGTHKSDAGDENVLCAGLTEKSKNIGPSHSINSVAVNLLDGAHALCHNKAEISL